MENMRKTKLLPRKRRMKKIEMQVLDPIEWDCACGGAMRLKEKATHSKNFCFDGQFAISNNK